jgi:ferric-dicitrate binding protein FerR (iron transport regulator)
MTVPTPHPVREPDDFHAWTLLYLEDGLGEEEQQAFRLLLRSSPEARQAFARAAQFDAELYELRRAAAGPAGADPGNRSSNRISSRRVSHVATRRRLAGARRASWAPALAAAGLLAAISLVVVLSKSRSPGPAGEDPQRPRGPVERAEFVEASEEAGRSESPKGPAPSRAPSRRAEEVPEPPGPVEPPEAAARPEPERRPAEGREAAGVEPPRPARDTAAAGAAPPVGIAIGRVEGEVYVVAGSEKVRAPAGRAIAPGEGLQAVGAQSGATVAFRDGTRVDLGPGTVLREIVEGSRGKRIGVTQGRVAAQVARQPADRPLVIATPHAEVKVLGTRLSVGVSPGSTRVEVSEGRVRVTRQPDGASVELTAGLHAVASPGVPLAARPRERVIWSFDLEDGLRPAALLEGKVAPGPPRPGNRFSLESSDYVAREWGPAINLKLDETLQADPANVRLRFRYFAAGGRMTVQFFDETVGDNFGVVIGELVQGRWAWVDVPLSFFARWTDRSRLRKGDRLVFLQLHVIVRGNPAVYWDDVELVEILGK